MGKLVLEESVIIQVLGWGLECRRLLLTGYVWGMDMTIT